jgi:uncharacterized spore protein YtfJ
MLVNCDRSGGDRNELGGGHGGKEGSAREVLTTRRVYGEPYERDGVTVIPAAAVMGGAGGGGGEGPNGETGGGSGFGLRARPVGAYVIRDGEVRWEPAFDLNRAVLLGQLLLLATVVLWRRASGRRR